MTTAPEPRGSEPVTRPASDGPHQQVGFTAVGGVLDAGVRELAEGRAYNIQPFRRPLPP
jgi:hypothetical protein